MMDYPTYRSHDDSQNYLEKDLLATDAFDQLPLISAIGAGPRGKGLTVREAVNDPDKPELILEFIDDVTGDVIYRTPNLAGYSFDVYEEDGYLVFSFGRDGEYTEKRIKLPEAARTPHIAYTEELPIGHLNALGPVYNRESLITSDGTLEPFDLVISTRPKSIVIGYVYKANDKNVVVRKLTEINFDDLDLADYSSAIADLSERVKKVADDCKDNCAEAKDAAGDINKSVTNQINLFKTNLEDLLKRLKDDEAKHDQDMSNLDMGYVAIKQPNIIKAYLDNNTDDTTKKQLIRLVTETSAGKYMLIFNENGDITLWDTDNKKVVWKYSVPADYVIARKKISKAKQLPEDIVSGEGRLLPDGDVSWNCEVWKSGYVRFEAHLLQKEANQSNGWLSIVTLPKALEEFTGITVSGSEYTTGYIYAKEWATNKVGIGITNYSKKAPTDVTLVVTGYVNNPETI